MAVVNEHPDTNVRKLYAGQVASHTGLPINDLVAIASRRTSRPDRASVGALGASAARRTPSSWRSPCCLQRWHDMAGWLDEVLFVDDVARRAFLAVAEGDGSVERSLELADPEARELIERAAVADIDADPAIEGRNLIAAAVRRELATHCQRDRSGRDPCEQRRPTGAGALRRAIGGERCGRAVARVAATAQRGE